MTTSLPRVSMENSSGQCFPLTWGCSIPYVVGKWKESFGEMENNGKSPAY